MGGGSCSFSDCFLPSIILATLFGILLLLVIFALFRYMQLARIITAINRAWRSDGTCYTLTETDQCRLHANDTLGDLPQAVVSSSFNPSLAWRLLDLVARVELAPNIPQPPGFKLIKNLQPSEGPTFGVIWQNGKSLVVAFRCTLTHEEIQDDFNAYQLEFDTGNRAESIPLKSIPNVAGALPLVHSGFYSVSFRFLQEIIEIIQTLNPSLLFICGHSLGGAVGTVTSTVLAEHFPNLSITTYVCGTPRVGNAKFNDRVMTLKNLTLWRIVNYYDQIQDLPFSVTPNFAHPKDLPFYYEHAGNAQIYFDNRGSWRSNHNLPNYISYVSQIE